MCAWDKTRILISADWIVGNVCNITATLKPMYQLQGTNEGQTAGYHFLRIYPSGEELITGLFRLPRVFLRCRRVFLPSHLRFLRLSNQSIPWARLITLIFFSVCWTRQEKVFKAIWSLPQFPWWLRESFTSRLTGEGDWSNQERHHIIERVRTWK